jgi:hypothetical protein
MLPAAVAAAEKGHPSRPYQALNNNQITSHLTFYCFPVLREEPPRYQYRPFEGNRQIRLIAVTPPKLEHFHCDYKYNIVTASLDSAPSYEPVSYVWGAGDLDQCLFLKDGSFLEITNTLSSALPTLSRHYETGYLWIDQLYINQDDVAERSRQVKLMIDVYRLAKRVLVFLHNIDDVASLKQLIEAVNGPVAAHERLQTVLRPCDNARWGAVTDPAWLSVLRLFDNQWFLRAWVFQEAVVCRNVTSLSKACWFPSGP